MNSLSRTHVSLLFFLLLSATLTSCFAPNPVSPEPDPPDDPEPSPVDTTGFVAPDGTLETVTWNLAWYGHPFGPEDEVQQTNNFITIFDTINADLYAFQEISDQQSLSRLTTRMKGYRGFVAKNMGGSQRTAFVYNTRAIDSLSSGLIIEGHNEHDWAGRFPFYFKFNYHSKDTTTLIYAVVIHAKCCADAESYNRRKDAAQDLYDYLSRNKPSAILFYWVIIMTMWMCQFFKKKKALTCRLLRTINSLK